VKIVFLCTGNSIRSQIAEAITKHLSKELGKDVEVFSAGSDPAGYIHALAKKVLEEVGIDTSGLYSKGIEEVPVHEADLIITLCDSAKKSCPKVPGAKVVHWSIPDPAGRGLFAFRWVRDELYRRIKLILKDF